MAWRFDRLTNSYAQFAVAPLSGTVFGPFTWAILIKFNETFSRPWLAITTSGSGFRAQFSNNSSTDLTFTSADGSNVSTGTVGLTTTPWYLIVVTATSSTSVSRFHVYNGTSWSHFDGSGANAATTIASGDLIRLACRLTTTTGSCDIVCAGIKKAVSSDAACTALTVTAFQSWRDFGFDWLVGLDASLAVAGVIQDQASPGTGDETARQAITAVSDPAGWAWTSAVVPVANFTGTPLTGTAPLSVAFTDTSTNVPTSWAWTFGDGGTSTSQNPSHSYTTPGVYTVTLIATNGAGSNTKTRTAYVAVAETIVYAAGGGIDII